MKLHEAIGLELERREKCASRQHCEKAELQARIEALEKLLTIIRDGEAFLGSGDCLTASELAAEALLQEPTK